MLWQISVEQFLVTLAAISAVTYISGWIADAIMGRFGFGQIGNWLLLTMGVYSGLYAYNLYGYKIGWYPMVSLSVAAGSACVALLFMAAVKRAVDA